jgi:hypothetical protein
VTSVQSTRTIPRIQGHAVFTACIHDGVLHGAMVQRRPIVRSWHREVVWMQVHAYSECSWQPSRLEDRPPFCDAGQREVCAELELDSCYVR